MKLVLQVAGGIVIAALAVFLIRMAFVVAGMKAVGHAVHQMQATVEQRAVDMQARVEAQQAERLRLAEQAKRAELEAHATRMQEEAEAARAQQAEAARKLAAWGRFYKPAKECENPPDWDTQVECGNAHIRAQRAFETRWANGEMR